MKRNNILYYLLSALVIAGIYYAFRYYSASRIYYYGYYTDVAGLQEAAPIYLKGVKVGKVGDVQLQDDGKIKVTYGVKDGTALPRGTVARIGSDGLSGGMAIFMKPGTGPVLQPEAIMLTAVDSSVTDKFHAKISPMITTSKTLIHQTDSALTAFNQLVSGGWGVRTQQEVERFSVVLNNLAKGAASVNKSTSQLPAMVDKAHNATGNPAKINSDMNARLASSAQKTGELRNNNIRQNLENMSTSLNKLSQTIKNAGNNKLLTDKQVYESTTKSLDTLNRSLKETRDNPKGFVLFPKKKK